MAQHDEYGKRVLTLAVGSRYTDSGGSVEINYGAGLPARIDGTIGNNIAVEIESRVSKQVRGAVLDLICHSYPRKLLVLLPAHMSNPETTAKQCSMILSKFLKSNDFQVVILTGNGDEPNLDEDIEIVKRAISILEEVNL